VHLLGVRAARVAGDVALARDEHAAAEVSARGGILEQAQRRSHERHGHPRQVEQILEGPPQVAILGAVREAPDREPRGARARVGAPRSSIPRPSTVSRIREQRARLARRRVGRAPGIRHALE
jgi:hypothetical protein